MRSKATGVVAGIALAMASAVPVAAQYRVTEIARGAVPAAINASSQVVGSLEAGGGTHCFFWDGTLHDLGSVGPGDCHATGLSDAGLLVGTRTDPASESWQAFTCDVFAGRCADVPPPRGWSTVGFGINARGQVVGGAWDPAGRQRPFLFDGRATRLLGDDGFEGTARAINDAGVIVGEAMTGPGGETLPFRWESGVITSLGTAGGRNGEARAISSSGVVAGTSTRRDERPVAFRNVGREGLDVLVEAPSSHGMAVNTFGAVVGDFETGHGRHALLADGRTAYDLNDLLPAGSGWVLEAALAINDAGVIVGYGTHAGAPAAFLLAPR
jgi:probable HAF family extracellular repeat protein